VVVASAGLAVAPSKATALAMLVACVVQTTCALTAVKLLRGRALPWRYAPLEIGRSYVALACWARAWASRRIAWRGHPFVLGAGTVISPLEAPPAREAREELAA
jgi:hypothetical protein